MMLRSGLVTLFVVDFFVRAWLIALQELFASTVGPVKDCQLNYTPQGKWNGSAMVLFSRKGDGNKAYEQYNNRLIDRS